MIERWTQADLGADDEFSNERPICGFRGCRVARLGRCRRRRMAPVARAGRTRSRRCQRPADHLEREGERGLAAGDSRQGMVLARHFRRPHLADDSDRHAPYRGAEKKKLEGNTNNQPLNLSGRLSLRAVCVDRNTGKLLHDVETLVQEEPDPIHQLNTFASPSPVLAGDRLFCHFGTNGTACVDAKSGKVLWTNLELKIKHENGPGSTPVAWEDLLIVHCDGSDVQYIAALEQSTGKIRWKTPRSGDLRPDPQLKKAYGTPLIATLNGAEVVLSPGADWLYGYEPATGKELWKLNYGVLGFSIVPRPVLGGTRLFMSTSFIKPELLAIDLAGEPTIAWRVKKQVPNMPSPLLVGNELYLVADLGVASCLDAKTGDIVWAERLGGNFSSSPLYADGRIYAGNREGSTFVIQPGREYKLLATNVLEGSIMATPAAVGSSLYLRTDKALYRIDGGKALARK